MFKSIKSGVTKKQDLLRENRQEIEKADKIFNDFIFKEYGQFSSDLNLTLCLEAKSLILTIETLNKTIACEMNLKIGQLAAEFKKNNVRLNQIVIK